MEQTTVELFRLEGAPRHTWNKPVGWAKSRRSCRTRRSNVQGGKTGARKGVCRLTDSPVIFRALAGLRRFVFCFSFGGVFRCGCFERGKNHGGGLLNHFQALGQKCGVAVVQVNVIGGCPSGFEADGLANDEGDCLGFRLAYSLGGCGAAFCLVQHFVREFVNEGRKLLGGFLTRKENNSPAVAYT
jgi:hypothetical protein